MPLTDSINELLARLNSATGGAMGGALRFVGSAVGVILTPFGWLITASGSLAFVLAYVLEVAFIPAQPIARWLGGAVDPMVMAVAGMLLLLRLVMLRWVSRGADQLMRMRALAPQIKLLQRLHAGDRPRLEAEMQQLQARADVNPLAGCLPILVTIVAIASAWRLLRGLTVRSEEGTFDPEFLHDGTRLARHLGSTGELETLSMSMTATVFDVGWCASLLPYLLMLVALLATTRLSLRQVWRKQPAMARFFLMVTFLFTIFLPCLVILLRIFDQLLVSAQNSYLDRRRERYAAILAQDPAIHGWDDDDDERPGGPGSPRSGEPGR
ncbi:MAG TPA: YidC/Oxa1 family membrane protein insertase [Pseudonocardiaceae bacterium]